MTILGILVCVEGNIIFAEIEKIERFDAENGYVKPKPIIRLPPKKKYYPPKDELGRSGTNDR